MFRKRVVAVAAGSVLIAAMTAAAWAHGFGGPGGGGHEIWLLARAAGLTHSQIASAFENDTKLQTDRANLKTAHDTMISCLLSGADCSSQVSAFSGALQSLAEERMTVWAGLFKGASPSNLSKATSVYSQLKQLRSQKKQILQGVFGSQNPEAGPASGSSSPSE
jgi:hypothetical protein